MIKKHVCKKNLSRIGRVKVICKICKKDFTKYYFSKK